MRFFQVLSEKDAWPIWLSGLFLGAAIGVIATSLVIWLLGS